MSLALLIARLLLAAVFLMTGLAKLADLSGSQQAWRDFGMPAALAPADTTCCGSTCQATC